MLEAGRHGASMVTQRAPAACRKHLVAVSSSVWRRANFRSIEIGRGIDGNRRDEQCLFGRNVRYYLRA